MIQSYSLGIAVKIFKAWTISIPATAWGETTRPCSLENCWDGEVHGGESQQAVLTVFSFHLLDTVDGCEILHHQLDSWNLIDKYKNHGMFTTYQPVQDFPPIHSQLLKSIEHVPWNRWYIYPMIILFIALKNHPIIERVPCT
jgi:hypothetical protein